MSIPTKLRPCSYCGKTGHLEFTCSLKPHKPLRAKKPMKKIGPVTNKWIRTKKAWLQENKAPYYFCYICNKLLTRTTLELDHIKSRSRHPELRFKLSNLAPCCHNCNQEKGSLGLEEYLKKRLDTA